MQESSYSDHRVIHKTTRLRQAAAKPANPPRGELDQFSDWSKSNALWVLGLAPFVLVAANMLVVSNGDMPTLRVLAGTVDPIQAALAAMTPVAPLVLLGFVPYVIENLIRGERTPQWTIPAALIALVFAMAVLPKSGLSVLPLYILMLGFVLYEKSLAKRGRPHVRVFNLTTTALVAVIGAFVAGPWMTLEYIELRDKEPVTAYVLDTKNYWTTLLQKDGGVMIVHGDEVETRTVCSSKSTSGSLLTNISHLPGRSAPLCSDLVGRSEEAAQEDQNTVPATIQESAPEVSSAEP